MVNALGCEHFGGNLFIFYKHEGPLILYTWYWGRKEKKFCAWKHNNNTTIVYICDSCKLHIMKLLTHLCWYLSQQLHLCHLKIIWFAIRNIFAHMIVQQNLHNLILCWQLKVSLHPVLNNPSNYTVKIQNNRISWQQFVIVMLQNYIKLLNWRQIILVTSTPFCIMVT